MEDIIEFNNFKKDNYSGFGNMILSKFETKPNFGFTQAKKKNIEKVFISKKLCKNQFIGNLGADPNYDVHDKFKYNKGPSYKISKMERNCLDIKPKYDHYKYFDDITNTLNAKQLILRKNPNYRIGSALKVLFKILN